MVGSTHELKIESLANSGDGVGRIEGRVIFVPFSCPGDILEIEITHDKKKFLKGRIKKIIQKSDNRIEPPCTHFTECGGCDWQHISYEEQLSWKRKNLAQVLERIAGIEDLPKFKIEASPKQFHYRNRIQLNYNQKNFSYSKKGSHQQVPIAQCLLADDKINEDMQKILKHLQKKSRSGRVELAVQGGSSVKTYNVDKNGQSELGFRQVNCEQNMNILKKTLDSIQDCSIDNLVDLYCGQGNWTLAVQQTFPHINCVGIDSNPKNISVAEKSKGPNTQFHLGKVEDIFANLETPCDMVIVDPPRAGCDLTVIDAITQKKASWLVYISCHPATLARDLKQLINKNWSLTELAAFDMFPQTAHLECWALLRSGS